MRKTEEVPIELKVIGVDTLVEGEVDKEAADYLEKEVFLEKIEAEEHPMAVTDERFRAKNRGSIFLQISVSGRRSDENEVHRVRAEKICGSFGRRGWRNADSGRGDCSNRSEFYERGRKR